MAKKVKREKGSAIQEEVKLELTPMIDVTFLILIFFMCTLKFKTLEGKLVSYLPTDKGLSSQQAPELFEDAEIILKVPKEDNDKPPMERRIIFLRNGSNTPFGESKRVIVDSSNPKDARFDLSPPNTLDEISKYLKSVRDASVESKAKINSYARCPHIYVVTILNRMMEAGFNEISYSGIPNRLLEDLTSGELR
jgi:biopolymer transport protein ExbD